MSDNGAERANAAFNAAARRRFIENNLDQSYDNMGNWNSYLGMSKGWARVQNAPFNMYKGSTFDGGVRTAAFVHYPKSQAYVSEEKEKYDGITSIMDIAPTFLKMAGLKFDPPAPAEPIATSISDPYTPTAPRTERQYGCSLADLLDTGSGSSLEGNCGGDRMIGWEVDGAKGFRWDVSEDRISDQTYQPPATKIIKKGQWKLSMTWGEGEKYYFFDLSEDKFERHELDSDYGDVYPSERNEMKGWIWDAYLEYARVNNVVPVGNPIVSDKNPTTFIINQPAEITYEGSLEMSHAERDEAITPIKMLSPFEGTEGKEE
jgi:arylsulfatase